MARKGKSDIERAVRQARSDVKEIQKRSREILKRAQLDVREYRKELSALKKEGIVSKRIDARTHRPTNYMISKLRKFKDVATGRAMAVPVSKLSPHRARQYVEKGTLQKRGKFLIVPKTAAKQRSDVIKGHVATYTNLGFGEERVIFLPYAANDLNDLVAQLKDNMSEINQLKERNEQFGFQLFGHNSKRGFPDAESLRSYLEEQYSHLLSKPSTAREAFKHFVLMRFRNRIGHPQSEPYEGTRYFKRGKENRRDDTRFSEYKRDREAKRKARQRERENDAQRNRRLERQRKYDQARANERREKRMAKRLIEW